MLGPNKCMIARYGEIKQIMSNLQQSMLKANVNSEIKKYGKEIIQWFIINRERNIVISNYIFKMQAIELYNENALPVKFLRSSG